ncbi:MAG TPA: DUF1659 domain-containing protein [Ureibacillus sp.]|nr:DUF1659 domain-containing protein [Ureibacillus sp.]
MAAFNFDNASLKLSFQTGVDQSGKAIVSAKTYRNLRNNLDASQVLAVVQAIASLSSYDLLYAEKVQTETIEV